MWRYSSYKQSELFSVYLFSFSQNKVRVGKKAIQCNGMLWCPRGNSVNSRGLSPQLCEHMCNPTLTHAHTYTHTNTHTGGKQGPLCAICRPEICPSVPNAINVRQRELIAFCPILSLPQLSRGRPSDPSLFALSPGDSGASSDVSLLRQNNKTTARFRLIRKDKHKESTFKHLVRCKVDFLYPHRSLLRGAEMGDTFLFQAIFVLTTPAS